MPIAKEISMPHIHPVVHFEILGRDQKLLEEFYKDVFNWEITPAWRGIRWSNPVPASAAASAPWEKTRHVTFYVAVEDVRQRLN